MPNTRFRDAFDTYPLGDDECDCRSCSADADDESIEALSYYDMGLDDLEMNRRILEFRGVPYPIDLVDALASHGFIVR